MFFTKSDNHKKMESLTNDIIQIAKGDLKFDVQEEYGGDSEQVEFELGDDWQPFNDPGVVEEGQAWHRRSEWVSSIHTDLDIVEIKAKKGFRLKRHSHDDHVEICVVLKGAVHYPMQNRHLMSGNTIEIPMDTKHTFEVTEDTFCLIIYKPKFQ